MWALAEARDTCSGGSKSRKVATNHGIRFRTHLDPTWPMETPNTFQGFSRVMTRPEGRVRRVSKCRGSDRVGSGGVRYVTVRVGSGPQVLNLWVRVGSGQDFSNLMGRVRSGQKVFKSPGRVGSSHQCSKCHGSGRVMTREIRVTRETRKLFSADPRVGPADLAGGSVFSQTYSCLPEGESSKIVTRGSGPRVRSYTTLPASCLKASLVPIIFRTPIAYHRCCEE